MSKKLSPEEYKTVHQRVCKILYAQMTSVAPAQDATKLLNSLDEKTKTREEFLEVLEKKLQRFQDPKGWILEKRKNIEQIYAKINGRMAVDPSFENKFTENGKIGLHIIRKIVETPPTELVITSEDISKVQLCMSELKSMVDSGLSGSNVPPANSAANTSQQNLSNTPPKITLKLEPPVAPTNPPASSPLTISFGKLTPTSKLPAQTSPNTTAQVSTNKPQNGIFEDGIFGIIIIELQYLLRKCSEKPSKLNINAFIGKFENLLSLLSGWYSRSSKHLDENYQSRINTSLHILTTIITDLQSLPVEETASIEVIWNHHQIAHSFPMLQMIVDEIVSFEMHRLFEKNFDCEAFMKKRRLDAEFQKRINELFQQQFKRQVEKKQKELEGNTILTEAERKERNRQLQEKVLDVYNRTVSDYFDFYFPREYQFGGIGRV